MQFTFIRSTQCCDCQDGSNDNERDFQRIFLFFRGNGMGVKRELQFLRQPDFDFRFYVTCTAILFVFLATIQGILLPR